jgi:hypothetical protein
MCSSFNVEDEVQNPVQTGKITVFSNLYGFRKGMGRPKVLN